MSFPINHGCRSVTAVTSSKILDFDGRISAGYSFSIVSILCTRTSKSDTFFFEKIITRHILNKNSYQAGKRFSPSTHLILINVVAIPFHNGFHSLAGSLSGRKLAKDRFPFPLFPLSFYRYTQLIVSMGLLAKERLRLCRSTEKTCRSGSTAHSFYGLANKKCDQDYLRLFKKPVDLSVRNSFDLL